uniref:Reverse transcriptase domain-containing protein n=1 Tax=Cannabis sativa TaxID=3483 RepID=A0A803Q0L9_CANSA
MLAAQVSSSSSSNFQNSDENLNTLSHPSPRRGGSALMAINSHPSASSQLGSESSTLLTIWGHACHSINASLTGLIPSLNKSHNDPYLFLIMAVYSSSNRGYSFNCYFYLPGQWMDLDNPSPDPVLNVCLLFFLFHSSTTRDMEDLSARTLIAIYLVSYLNPVLGLGQITFFVLYPSMLSSFIPLLLKMEDLARSFSAALHLNDTENTIHSLAEHVDPNEGLPPAPPQFHLMATLFTTKNFNHNALKNFLEKHWKGRFPVHNIPFSRRSISLAKLLGQIAGTLLEVHQPSLLETWGSYLRICIMFDVTKPLPRGIPIMFLGLASPTWLEMKYEDIPDHCYYCGRLGHSYLSCTEYMRASDESTQPPPLPYENVLRGTTCQNHGPFGLLPNSFLLNSTSIVSHPNAPTLNPSTTNLIPVHHPRGQVLQQDFSFHNSLGNYSDAARLFLSPHQNLGNTLLTDQGAGPSNPGSNDAPPRRPPQKKNQTTSASGFKRQLATFKLGFDFGFEVPRVSLSEGLLLFWNSDIDVTITNYFVNHIHCFISSAVFSSFNLTAFYGAPNPRNRTHTWEMLSRIGLSCISVLWCVFGDFNDFLTWDDKSSSNPRNGPSPLFRSFMKKFHLQALQPNGPRLTWTTNSQGNRNTLERLDWAVGNSIWHSHHPNSSLNHLDFFGSDHRAIPLSFKHTHSPQYSKKKDKRFLFENVWLSEPQWNDVLLEAWSSNTPSDDPSTSLLLKQSTCATFLSNWKHKAFFGFQSRIKQAQLALEQARNSEDTSPESYSRQKALQANLDSLLFKEETYWRQRSRIQWLNLGDKNTRFFHKFASNRKRSNRIDSLTSEDGTKLGSRPLPMIEPSHCQILEEAFSPSEVKKALFQMGPDKAPGIDGFNNQFYQKNWSVVGKDITEVVLSVLNNLTDISQFNTTLVTLIPKVRKPVSLKDYHPISLCTTIYKIISKVLANRLKLVLSPLISPNQSAFLKGRLISDNILMAQEILHSIKNKKHGRVSWMAVKLDMAKAFDRVEWKFLQKIMEKFGFPTRFIKLIMACITTATFKFNLNGKALGLVTPSRGIRQGDPFSPYLFLMCAEGLSSILKRAESHEEAFGIKIARTAPEISHLLFADDSILFCKSNIQACYAIKEALDQYQKVSGQLVNFQKSSLFFSPNTSLTYQTLIQDYLQIPMTNHLDKYLGLPQCFGWSKSSSFNSLKDRIWSYLSKWQGKLLSKGGKEVLLKAVVQAIPTYARNAAVFRNHDSHPMRIEQEAQEYLDFYQAVQNKHTMQPQSITDHNNLTWEPPPMGTLKLTVDAAVSSHRNKIGGGAIVRDSTGRVIAARAFSRSGQMQPKAAEGWALLEGLKWSLENGINVNHIEVDC